MVSFRQNHKRNGAHSTGNQKLSSAKGHLGSFKVIEGQMKDLKMLTVNCFKRFKFECFILF